MPTNYEVIKEERLSDHQVIQTLACGWRAWRDAQGFLHREGGVAIECPVNLAEIVKIPLRYPVPCETEKIQFNDFYCCGGQQYWYWHGKQHRTDGPAFSGNIEGDEVRVWCRYGYLHRENGPAVVGSHLGDKWFIGGLEYTEEEFDIHKTEFREFLCLQDKKVILATVGPLPPITSETADRGSTAIII